VGHGAAGAGRRQGVGAIGSKGFGLGVQQSAPDDHLPCVHTPLAPHDMPDVLHAVHFELHSRQSAVHLPPGAVQVRAAAVTLARALRGLTLRVTDRAQSSEGDAAAAVTVALPLLLEKGGASPRILPASCPAP
jgi:hypothetical protein